MKADVFWQGWPEFGDIVCEVLSLNPWTSDDAKCRFWSEVSRYHLHLLESATHGMVHHEFFCLELAEFLVVGLRPHLKSEEHFKLLSVGSKIMGQADLLPADQATALQAELHRSLASAAAVEWTACFFKRHWRCGAEAVAA